MANRSKQIDLGLESYDNLNNNFDMFNHTVRQGDLITIKVEQMDKLMVHVDFEFDIEMSESEALQNVKAMVTHYSHEPFELSEEQRESIADFSWKKFRESMDEEHE